MKGISEKKFARSKIKQRSTGIKVQKSYIPPRGHVGEV